MNVERQSVSLMNPAVGTGGMIYQDHCSTFNVNTGVLRGADFLVPQDNRDQMYSSSDPYAGPDSLKVDTQ